MCILTISHDFISWPAYSATYIIHYSEIFNIVCMRLHSEEKSIHINTFFFKCHYFNYTI